MRAYSSIKSASRVRSSRNVGTSTSTASGPLFSTFSSSAAKTFAISAGGAAMPSRASSRAGRQTTFQGFFGSDRTSTAPISNFAPAKSHINFAARRLPNSASSASTPRMKR